LKVEIKHMALDGVRAASLPVAGYWLKAAAQSLACRFDAKVRKAAGAKLV
jgi:hypothetical protein